MITATPLQLVALGPVADPAAADALPDQDVAKIQDLDDVFGRELETANEGRVWISPELKAAMTLGGPGLGLAASFTVDGVPLDGVAQDAGAPVAPPPSPWLVGLADGASWALLGAEDLPAMSAEPTPELVSDAVVRSPGAAQARPLGGGARHGEEPAPAPTAAPGSQAAGSVPLKAMKVIGGRDDAAPPDALSAAFPKPTPLSAPDLSTPAAPPAQIMPELAPQATPELSVRKGALDVIRVDVDERLSIEVSATDREIDVTLLGDKAVRAAMRSVEADLRESLRRGGYDLGQLLERDHDERSSRQPRQHPEPDTDDDAPKVPAAVFSLSS